MTSYLKKLLEHHMPGRLRDKKNDRPARSATPLLNEFIAAHPVETETPAETKTEAPARDLHVGHLPPGSRIVSNGNGKNVYLGEIPVTDQEEVLRLLDNDSLSLEEDSNSFDPYDHSDSWKPQPGYDRY